MKVYIQVSEIEVDLGENQTFNNCHNFTRAVILKLNDMRMLNAGLDQFVDDLQRAEKTKDILEAYNSAPGALIFDKLNMQSIINAPGLILFTVPTGIQHSMFAVGKNIWQGANNLGSLGAENDGVHIYRDMDQRCFQHGEAGGWNLQNTMCSLMNDQYTMYYIPLCRPW